MEVGEKGFSLGVDLVRTLMEARQRRDWRGRRRGGPCSPIMEIPSTLEDTLIRPDLHFDTDDFLMSCLPATHIGRDGPEDGVDALYILDAVGPGGKGVSMPNRIKSQNLKPH